MQNPLTRLLRKFKHMQSTDTLVRKCHLPGVTVRSFSCELGAMFQKFPRADHPVAAFNPEMSYTMSLPLRPARFLVGHRQFPTFCVDEILFPRSSAQLSWLSQTGHESRSGGWLSCFGACSANHENGKTVLAGCCCVKPERLSSAKLKDASQRPTGGVSGTEKVVELGVELVGNRPLC